jgi:hypothetical protein
MLPWTIALFSSALPSFRLFDANFGRSGRTLTIAKWPLFVKMYRPFGFGREATYGHCAILNRGPAHLWSIIDSMVEAVNLRPQAEKALRIARGISDEQAALALRAYAADLHKQAEWLEQQAIPPPIKN